MRPVGSRGGWGGGGGGGPGGVPGEWGIEQGRAARRPRPSPSLPLTLPFIAPQLVLNRIDERLPGSLDDVVRDADGPPRVIPIARGDQDPGARRGRLRLVEDAHLVVEQRHLAQIRVEVLEGLAQGVVE